jgi:hypothetical protein
MAKARRHALQRPPSRVERLLARAAGPDPETAVARLRILRRFLLSWGVVRSSVWLAAGAAVDPAWLGASAIVLGVATGLAFAPRLEHLAARLALPALLAQLAWTLPLTHNHFFLELYAVALLALAGRGGADAPLVLAGLRGLTALVLFQTGLQKLLYGHYFTGDFLAFMVGRGDRFATLFEWVLPAAEAARLQGYDPFQDGAGPYRVTQPLWVLISNGVWIAETTLPFALLAHRTRAVAAGIAIAFVLALQLGAREMGFALLFGNLLLLFGPVVWQRRLFPLFALLLALALVAVVFGPTRAVVEAWHLW